MRSYQLHVLVQQEPEGGWTAHVLDFDIVAGADSEAEVLEVVPGLVELYLRTLERDGSTDSVLRPARAEDWNRFFRSSPGQKALTLSAPVQLSGHGWVFEELELGCYRKAA